MTTTIRRIAAIAMAVTLSNIAHAEGGYIGVAGGQGSFVDNDSDFDQTALAYKVYAGYRLFKYLALEGYYIDFGDADERITVGDDVIKLGFDASGFAFTAVGLLPLHKRLTLFGKTGLLFSEYTITASLNDSNGGTEDNSAEFTYGLGAMFHVTPHLALRGEWETVELDSMDTDVASIAIQLNF